jgi:predicted AAA+ superfamily ATPase
MIDIDQQILQQNPWWANPKAILEDAHLTALERQALVWDPPVESRLVLEKPAIHTLRGPRQVGKTTTVKRLLRRLLDHGERRVLYFSLDLQTDYRSIPEIVRRARMLHPDPDGRWYLFLDEVTAVPDWARGIKYLWDQGLIRDDILLLTGSSAQGLKRGVEQLPGRRNGGRDFLHLPMSFRDFCRTALGMDLPPESLEPRSFPAQPSRGLVKKLHLRLEELDRALSSYLVIGGFPAAVSHWLRSQEPPADMAGMLWAIIASDVAVSGRSPVGALRLLDQINRSLGSFLKWSGAAEAMEAQKTDTARDYVHLLSESFLLLTIYYWGLGGHGFEPQRQRKVYFMDPLIGVIAPQLLPGARPAESDALRENLVGVGLYRSAAKALVQAAPIPGCIGYWKGKSGREIDFVVPPEPGADSQGPLAIEVKGDSRSNISDARRAIRRSFPAGMVLTRSILDLENEIPALPTAVFLSALEDHPQRVALTL